MCVCVLLPLLGVKGCVTAISFCKQLPLLALVYGFIIAGKKVYLSLSIWLTVTHSACLTQSFCYTFNLFTFLHQF